MLNFGWNETLLLWRETQTLFSLDVQPLDELHLMRGIHASLILIFLSKQKEKLVYEFIYPFLYLFIYSVIETTFMFPIPWVATLFCILKNLLCFLAHSSGPNRRKEWFIYLFIYLVTQAILMLQIPQDSSLLCLKSFIWLLEWLL